MMKSVCILFALLAVGANARSQSLAEVLATELPTPMSLLGQEAVTGYAKLSNPTYTRAIQDDGNSPFTHLHSFVQKPAALAAKKVVAPDIQDLRSDFSEMPGSEQLNGAFVKLQFAPGQSLNDEDVLPAHLIAPKSTATANEIMDAKLWREMTAKIHLTGKSLKKYNRWIQGAAIALSKVEDQLKATQENKGVIERGLSSMKYQRLQILKRLKSYKLKRDLEAAEKRMAQLKGYSEYLSKNKKDLTNHENSLVKRLTKVTATLEKLREEKK